MTGPQDAPLVSQKGDDEDGAVQEAMAAYSADGQVDDETGGDAKAGAETAPGRARGEGDREPHGPA
jgi:hypothetical protein